MDKVIIGDELWVFDYDPENKRQSEEWHTKSSPRPKKERMSRSRVKSTSMVIVFFDSRCIVHKEFVPPGQTVNPLSPELNSICYLLALLAHHFLHVSRIRVKSLTLR